MRGPFSLIVAGGIILGTAGAGGCHRKAPPRPVATPVADTTDLAALRAQIQNLVGDASCTDVTQCRLVAFGAKPCGGPRQYRVYSIAKTDSAALAAAVAQFNKRDAELNRMLHRTSDCSMVTRPTVTVMDGHCAIAP